MKFQHILPDCASSRSTKFGDKIFNIKDFITKIPCRTLKEPDFICLPWYFYKKNRMLSVDQLIKLVTSNTCKTLSWTREVLPSKYLKIIKIVLALKYVLCFKYVLQSRVSSQPGKGNNGFIPVSCLASWAYSSTPDQIVDPFVYCTFQ